jgi:peptidoglycan/LPS O-acetylase OafA/YrhL
MLDLTTDAGRAAPVATDAATRHRLPYLDAVRGLAITLILIWHYLVPVLQARGSPVAAAFSLAWTGVDCFFVLSGYLLGGILLDRRESANLFSAFYGRRFFRIVPMYAVLLATFSVSHGDSLLPYVTFTQNFVWAATSGWGPQWMAPTLSLAVEEQFYLVLPLLIWLVPSRRLPHVLLALIALAPVIRVVLMTHLSPLAAYILMPARMDTLFAGVLAAWLMRSRPHAEAIARHRVALWLALGILLLGVALASGSSRPLSILKQTSEYFWMAALYFVILLLVVSTKTHSSRVVAACAPLRWAGIGSYSLYLFHFPVLLTMPRFVSGEMVVPASLAALLLNRIPVLASDRETPDRARTSAVPVRIVPRGDHILGEGGHHKPWLTIAVT